VQGHGVFGSIDRGHSWYQVGKASMDRMQRRYHSITINPYDPAEVWVAHFGSSFSKIIDPVAFVYLEQKFAGANLAKNPSFGDLDPTTGFARDWRHYQPTRLAGEQPVISLSDGGPDGDCVRFNLTRAYSEAPSTRPADIEQRRLEATGEIPVDAAWANDPENRGDTRSWLVQRIDPYFVHRARGQIVRIEFDLRVLQRERQDWWLRWAEGCEVERFPPQLCLYEVRERHLNRIVAETYIERYNATPENYLGQWIHLVSEGRVSEHALGLNLVLTGTGMHSGMLEAKASNLSLRIVEDSGTPTCKV
jgi:hypothetical protein